MLIAPPYLYDYQIYPLVDQADRWLLNKLHLAEALGHSCGPVGLSVPDGRYCLRPMNSVRGLGAGGFFDVTVDTANNQFMPVIPGYFWCEWFPGANHRFTHFINDVAVHSSLNPVTNGVMRTTGNTAYGVLTHAVPMPAFLQGKSRYMMIESIGTNIIEVAFRLMGINARQELIDDYKTVDPTYDPQDITFGNSDAAELVYTVPDQNGLDVVGKKWNAGLDNRRPFDT
jgi:hypothetical protein